MKIDNEYCDNLSRGIFKALKIFLLSTCINDDMDVGSYNVSKVSDEELLEIIEKFQGPYLDICNRLIKRFMTKPVGIGPKESPEFEKIVDELLNLLYSTTKALEILITCVCAMVGFLRELNFRYYMNYINTCDGKCSVLEVLTEFNKYLSSDEVKEGICAVLSRKCMEVYSGDIKYKIPKLNIQTNTFINMELDKEAALKALKQFREASENNKLNEHRVPNVLKTGKN